jgi:hypothetical protein
MGDWGWGVVLLNLGMRADKVCVWGFVGGGGAGAVLVLGPAHAKQSSSMNHL